MSSAYIEISKLLAVSRPKTPTLRIGLNPDEASNALKAIKIKLDRFKTVCEEIVEATKLPAKPSVTALIAESELELLTEFLSQDFQEKYRSQIATYENRTSLEKFLKSVFRSEVSDLQKLAAFREKLAKLSRFSDQNETFSCFIERAEAIGKQMVDSNLATKETVGVFIRDTFNVNLSPDNRAFLIQQGKSEEDVAVIAEFLDARQMHILRPSVNALENKEISELKAQNDRLTQTNREISEKFDRLSAMFEAHLANTGPVSVQNVNTGTRRPPTRQRRQPYHQRPRNHQDRIGRCQSCGIRGHTKEQCRSEMMYNALLRNCEF